MKEYAEHAKDELDFIIKVADRLEYVENVEFDLTSEYMSCSFDSIPESYDVIDNLSSCCSVSAVKIDDETSRYTVVVDNY